MSIHPVRHASLVSIAVASVQDVARNVPNLQMLPLTASPSTFQIGLRGDVERIEVLRPRTWALSVNWRKSPDGGSARRRACSRGSPPRSAPGAREGTRASGQFRG